MHGLGAGMNPTALAQKADRKFSQYGQLMEFVQEIEGETNPNTGQPDITRNVTTFMGMWDTPKLQEIGPLIQVDDSVIWCGGLAIPSPDITDWIRVDGQAWDIIYVDFTKPGAVPILYKIFVRGAGSADRYTRSGRI